MELQLGLALSAYTPSVKVVVEKQKLPWRFESESCYSKKKNKRGFGEALEKIEDNDDDEVSARQGLPLLLWHGQPNGEDDDHNGLGKRASCPINK